MGDYQEYSFNFNVTFEEYKVLMNAKKRIKEKITMMDKSYQLELEKIKENDNMTSNRTKKMYEIDLITEGLMFAEAVLDHIIEKGSYVD
jgi:hypothetical protein